jgi:fatty acid desaturase
MVASIGPHVVMSFVYGWTYWATFLPSTILLLLITDPMLLSQHCYLPWKYASEQTYKVRPVQLRQQDDLTRELIFSPWVSNYVFMYFNYHIAHHYLPKLPSYQLPRLKYSHPNRMTFWEWIKFSKPMSGFDLVNEQPDNLPLDR